MTSIRLNQERKCIFNQIQTWLTIIYGERRWGTLVGESYSTAFGGIQGWRDDYISIGWLHNRNETHATRTKLKVSSTQLVAKVARHAHSQKAGVVWLQRGTIVRKNLWVRVNLHKAPSTGRKTHPGDDNMYTVLSGHWTLSIAQSGQSQWCQLS